MKYRELHNFPANIAIFQKKQLDKIGNIAIHRKQIHRPPARKRKVSSPGSNT